MPLPTVVWCSCCTADSPSHSWKTRVGTQVCSSWISPPSRPESSLSPQGWALVVSVQGVKWTQGSLLAPRALALLTWSTVQTWGRHEPVYVAGERQGPLLVETCAPTPPTFMRLWNVICWWPPNHPTNKWSTLKGVIADLLMWNSIQGDELRGRVCFCTFISGY